MSGNAYYWIDSTSIRLGDVGNTVYDLQTENDALRIVNANGTNASVVIEGTVSSGTVQTTDVLPLRVVATDAQSKLVHSTITLDQLNQFDDSISILQQAEANKQDVITGASTTILDTDLPPNVIMTSDAQGKVHVTNVSTTEFETHPQRITDLENAEIDLSLLEQSVLPKDGDAYDIGSTTRLWRTVHASHVNTGNASVGRLTVPNIDSDTVYIDANVVVTGRVEIPNGILDFERVQTSVIPDTHKTLDIGTTNASWNTVYASDTHTNSIQPLDTPNVVVDGDLVVTGALIGKNGEGIVPDPDWANIDATLSPSVDMGYSLGSNERRWSNVWTQGLVGAGDDVTVYGNLVLTENLLGPDGNVFKDIDLNFVSTNIVPTQDTILHIGDPVSKWTNVWAETLHGNLDASNLYGEFEGTVEFEGAFPNILPRITVENGSLLYPSMTFEGKHESGMYLEANGSYVGLSLDGQSGVRIGNANVQIDHKTIVSGNVVPDTTRTWSLGTSESMWANAYLGNASITDNLSVGGFVSSNLTPNSTHTLGTVQNPWEHAYVSTITATTVNVQGSLTSGDIVDLQGNDAVQHEHIQALEANAVSQHTKIDALEANSSAQQTDIEERVLRSGDTMTGLLAVPAIDVVSNIDVHGNVIVDDDLYIAGNIISLNGDSFNIDFTNIQTGIVPAQGTYDLGSDTNRWNDVYVANAVILGDTVITESGGNVVLGDVNTTSVSGDGSGLLNIDASKITSGTIQDARISGSYTGITNLSASGTVTASSFNGNHAWADITGVPVASTTQAGIVQLSSSTTSTSETTAATSSGLKTVSDLATTKVSKTGDTMSGSLTAPSFIGNGSLLTQLNASSISSGTVNTSRLPNASTSAKGIVQLNNTTTSTSTSEAATAGILKTVNDNVNTRALQTTTITAGSGLSGGGSLASNRTISHADTSTQSSVNNSGGVVIQDVTLDGFGHVTGLGSVDLNSLYYTETESDARFLQLGGGTLSGTLTAPGFIGSGSQLTQLNASAISTGTVNTARLPSASTTAKGIVQLSNTVTSTSTSLAATAGILKTVNDNANSRVPKTTTITAGTGLSGGGSLSSNLSFSVSSNLFNNFDDIHGNLNDFNSTYDFGWRFIAGDTNGPGTGGTQYYSLYTGLGSTYSSSEYGMQLAYPRNVLNPYMSIRYREGGIWGSWQKVSAGYADRSGVADSVSWANVTGIAQASTSAAGIVQLSSSVSSTSTTLAATSSAVKATYDLAAGRVPFILDSGADITSRISSGFYENSSAAADKVGWPTGADDWWHLLSNTHSASTYYSMQLACSFFGMSDLWFRTTDGDGTKAWRKVAVLDTSDNLSIPGDITAFASDRRLKTNIKPVSNALDIATTLQGYRYTWREDVDGLTMRGNDLGLIAQDLADAGLNECLALAPFDNDDGVSRSGEDYKTIKYNKLHAIWASAFRELKELNDQKDETIRSLEERIRRIEDLVQANL